MEETAPINTFKDVVQQSIDMLEAGVVWRKNSTQSGVSSRTVNSLEHIERSVYGCRACTLCENRKHAVPGTGVKNPLVMVIGEAPGAKEDEQGLPFVGKSGQYLDKWLEAVGLFRHKNVYISNVVKCRPPGNRDPHPDEVSTCKGFLQQQIEVLKPKVLFSVGRIASHILTGEENTRMNDMRRKEYVYQQIPLLVTYHPSAVLRNPQELRPLVWQDLKKLKNLLDK